MSLVLVAVVGVLAGTGTFLVIQRSLSRIILGVGLLANAVNLLILITGGPSGGAPIAGRADDPADPLPQAFVLTAIVIGLAVVAFLLALAWRAWTIDGEDDVDDDVEDRMLARQAARQAARRTAEESSTAADWEAP